MKNNSMLIVIILVILVGAGGFFAGMQYQKSQSPIRQFGSGQFGMMRNGNGTGRNGARPVSGNIIASDDKSITVKEQDGSTVIILVTGSTSINKATAGTKSDLVTGSRVAAFGTQNADGTFTATNVQINPAFEMRGGNGSAVPPSGTPPTGQ